MRGGESLRWSRAWLKVFSSTRLTSPFEWVTTMDTARIVHGHNAYPLQILPTKDSGTGFPCNSNKFEAYRVSQETLALSRRNRSPIFCFYLNCISTKRLCKFNFNYNHVFKSVIENRLRIRSEQGAIFYCALISGVKQIVIDRRIIGSSYMYELWRIGA